MGPNLDTHLFEQGPHHKLSKVKMKFVILKPIISFKDRIKITTLKFV